MQEQWNKLWWWICGGGMLACFLMIPEFCIAKFISQGNNETFQFYLFILVLITLSIYLVVSVTKLVKYIRRAKEYDKERIEIAKTELSSEFKKVLLKYSEPIFSKELFECQAKVDDDGKIVCNVKLDCNVKFENYEEFLKNFHFTEE